MILGVQNTFGTGNTIFQSTRSAGKSSAQSSSYHCQTTNVK